MKRDPELVDYDSAEFSTGFTTGKTGGKGAIPSDCVTPVQQNSWLEGWLMGNEEQAFDDLIAIDAFGVPTP